MRRDNEFEVDENIDNRNHGWVLQDHKHRLELNFGGRKKPNSPNIFLNINRPKKVRIEKQILNLVWKCIRK